MKAALLLCALALASATSAYQDNQQSGNRQQNMLQLFVNVQQQNYNQQQREYGNSFQFNKNQFSNYHAVKQFQNTYEQGSLLRRGQVFNYNNPNHLEQAIQLFDVFYFANDYDTFYQAACWARDRVNEGQFTYALSVAIVKRQDCQGVALPPQSEVHPHMYVNARAIQSAQNHKQRGQNQHNVQSNHTSNYVCNQQRRQRQQQQQQQHQNQYQYPFNHRNQNNDNENQANQYMNQQEHNFEGRVAYFNEDVDMNQHFANQQIYNPNWFNSQKYNNKNQHRNGENFYYYMQQVLARHNLERYANDLPRVRPFQFNQNIQHGYNPQLQYHNGQAMPARPHNVNFNHANQHNRQQLKHLDRRFAEAVDRQQVQTHNGGKQALNADNGVEILGNLVQANENSVNTQYYATNNGLYGYFDMFRKAVGSIVDAENQNQAAPGAIENNSAAMRDPVFYQIIARIVNYFQNFKNQLQSYRQEQLNFQGVEVQSVKMDELETYFDNSHVDMYNAINYQEGEQAEQYKYNAYQQRLNCKPFNYNIQVRSDQNTDAIVRVFIGPQYDVQGNQYSMEQARQNFVEIDRFVANLKNGQNQIQRNSQESTRFVQRQPNTRDLYNQAQQGNYYNQSAQYEQQYTMPQNLILPRGSQHGQQYVFAVAVHQYQPDQQGNNQRQPCDNRPEGFPFDRQVRDSKNMQQAKNIYFQTVTVYNRNQNNQ